MRSQWLWWGLPLAVAGLLVSVVVSDDKPADDQEAEARKAKAEDAARKTRIYDDPMAWAQMSGAKRTALERKFGVRPGRGVAFTGEEFTADRARTFAAITAPFSNVLVNKPAADTTAQDTQ